MAYGRRLARVVAEVTGLAGHRAEVADLPEQPLVHLDAARDSRRVELAGLVAEILQDGARLEDRDRPAARARRGSTMAGMRLLGEIARNSGVNCSPFWMSTYFTVYGSPVSSSMMEIFQPLGVGQ